MNMNELEDFKEDFCCVMTSKEHAIISEPFPELYFWICTQGIKVQQKIQNNV